MRDDGISTTPMRQATRRVGYAEGSAEPVARMTAETIIIAAEGVKREVPIPFAICGSRRALEILAAHLNEALAREDSARFSYGWLDIYPKPAIPSNTRPTAWSAA